MESKDHYVILGDARFHYREYGAASNHPLVFLHGILASAGYYEYLLRRLGRRSQVFALDQRGHGETARMAHYSWESLAEDLALFVTKLGLSSFDLVGHSMGAGVALMYASTSSDAVEHLVLLEGGMSADSPDQMDFWMKVAQAFPEEGFASREETHDLMVGLFPRASGEALTTTLEILVERPDGRWDWPNQADPRILGDIGGARPIGVEKMPGQITCPTLLVHAEYSELFTEDRFQKTLPAYPGAQGETLSASGHLLMWEAPDSVAALVERFLSS